MRVLVAMSGGVDSSVAAAMMVEAGHEVIGVTLKLWEGPGGELPTAGCCTVADAEDARRVAARLDIPYYVLDYTDHFMNGVVDRFVAEYVEGRTPNPCVECNRTVKFDRLLGHALELGCEALVTGHYARVRRDASGWHLLRGIDPTKDQSYVLSMLGQAELARTLFPVGEQTKVETRAIAGRLGLRTALKPDSQDICFVGQGDYRAFVRGRAPGAAIPGPIVDLDGVEQGRHEGVYEFTIGQRKGLGVAMGEPRYVVGIDAGTATVTIGPAEDVGVRSAVVRDMSFVAGRPPRQGMELSAQVRYKGDAVQAVVSELGGEWHVEFDTPQPGVAPGQTAVLYEGDEVIGGGIIAARGAGRPQASRSG